jgi:hypothetical protein
MRKQAARAIGALGAAFSFLLLFSLWGCSANLFAEFANKSADDALLYDANMQMSQKQWTSAIADFQKMSSAALASGTVISAYSSAYAGRCGLDLIALANALSSASGANLFNTLMLAFKGAAAAQAADCVQAEALLKTVSTYSGGRTVDQNTLMAFIALADIGVRLAAYADPLGDGLVDNGWDPCSSSPFGPPQAAPGSATDASTRQIGVDFNLMADSLSASGMPTLIGPIQASLATICSAMLAAFPTYAICGSAPLNLDPTAWTNLQVSAIAGLIRTNSPPGLAIVAKPLAPSGASGAFCL